MKEQISLLGNYGHQNLGDEAILTGFADATKRVRPDLLPILVFSDDPVDTAARQDKDTVRAERFRRALGGRIRNLFGILKDVLGSLRRARHLVLAGGGLINDSNRTSLVLYSAIVLLAPLTRTKVHGFAISIGPLDSAWGRVLACFLVRRLATLAVRDAESQRVARRLGRPDTALVPDAALAMNREMLANAIDGRSDAACTVAVSVLPLGKPRAWYECNPAEYDSYLRMMVQLVTGLIREQRARVLLLPINITHDSAVGVEIWNAVPVEDRRFCETVEATRVRDVLDAVRRADVVVACRLHSAVLATFVGRPFVALAYQDKVSSYAADVGLGRFTADIRRVGADKCRALLIDCLNEEATVQEVVGAYAAQAAPTFDVQWRSLLDRISPKVYQ